VFFAKVSLFLLNPDPPQFKQLRETSETQHLCPLNPAYRADLYILSCLASCLLFSLFLQQSPISQKIVMNLLQRMYLKKNALR
jgi:hypothetical protein